MMYCFWPKHITKVVASEAADWIRLVGEVLANKMRFINHKRKTYHHMETSNKETGILSIEIPTNQRVESYQKFPTN